MSIYSTVFKGKQSNDNIAIKYENRCLTYARLNGIIQGFSSYLLDRRLGKNQRVLILLPNCPEFVIAFFSVVSLGAVPVLVDIKFNEELHDILLQNNIRWIITNNNGISKISSVLGVADYNQVLSRYRIILDKQIEERFAGYESEQPLFDDGTLYDEEAMILYTSGSTGRPKGVLNSHKNLQAALQNYISTTDFKPSDKLVSVVPFFHSYGFGSCMVAGLAAGAMLLMMDNFNPRKILECIEEEKATIFHGVPYMYKLINEQLQRKSYNLNSLHLCISAGAPLQSETAEDFYKLTDLVIHQEYGSSETGTIAVNLSKDKDMNIRSVGKPLKNVRAKILYTEEMDRGNILINSPAIAVGYISEKPFDNEWYAMADVGWISEDGYIHINGRSDRVINVAGMKVDPFEVEAVLMNYSGVKDALVRGGFHQESGQFVDALVVYDAPEFCETEILEFCQKHLALYKVPKWIKKVDFILKSNNGGIKE